MKKEEKLKEIGIEILTKFENEDLEPMEAITILNGIEQAIITVYKEEIKRRLKND